MPQKKEHKVKYSRTDIEKANKPKTGKIYKIKVQDEKTKAAYANMKKNKKPLTLAEKLNEINESYSVTEQEDKILANLFVEYTIGDTIFLEEALRKLDIPVINNYIESEIQPEITYAGALTNGSKYQIKIISDIRNKNEEIEFSIIDMNANKKLKDYDNLIHALDAYITHINDQCYCQDSKALRTGYYNANEC